MCKAAKELHRTIGELLAEEVPKLPGDASRRKFWELMAESVRKNLPEERQEESQPQAEKQRIMPQSYLEASELIDSIGTLADDICDNGRDFAESVVERAESIGESVERAGCATDNQLAALQNMKEGLERWFHD